MIYLKKKETDEVIGTYENVIAWGYNFVEYRTNELRAKIYCNENEYFTDSLNV